ncbi:zinc finger CCCH domain-containing protein 8 isoform X1 [Oryza brachyantha]|uniref:zinc finger CCCH domain-containing protein 8 isoform X1 n=1 Tax=Oryza brachyantha TaxID=4533 RepID=UPI001ADB74F6|nr:zinc finger CCCH domain-containing protein 8 isoform X1 [Oryza brachyantha]
MSDSLYPYGHGAVGEGAGAAGYSSYEIDLIAARYGGGPLTNPSSAADARPVGARRSTGVRYHQPIMGSHSTVEQIEALYSSNTMVKRPRLESSLPIYPQRPGAKDCAFYMMTRTCKFRDSCKFDHPQWVPEGGIPDWKEQAANLEESYPERQGEPDCPFFMKTGKCKFGSKCKFNHPKGRVNALASGKGNEKHPSADSSILPVRPSEPICSFYAKTGTCKFLAKCKFNHPKDIEVPSDHNESENAATVEGEKDIGAVDDSISVKMSTPIAAQEFNSKGLPIRPGEVDCPFYMKMGSCKFGSSCRFNHPDRLVLNFPLGQTIIPTPESILLNPAANFMQSFDFHAARLPVGPGPIAYPQRPGATVCDFYMKTGFCKFSDRCKFHHPIDRSAPDRSVNWEPAEDSLQLTLAGLPRREDAEVCDFYMKTGVCKFGMQCKFDHPPPQEAIAKVSNSGS